MDHALKRFVMLKTIFFEGVSCVCLESSGQDPISSKLVMLFYCAAAGTDPHRFVGSVPTSQTSVFIPHKPNLDCRHTWCPEMDFRQACM